MRYITGYFFIIFSVVFSSCGKFEPYMLESRYYWAKGEYERAFDKLADAKSVSPQKGAEVDTQFKIFLKEITEKCKTNEQQIALLENHLANSEHVLNAVYFYKNSYGLAVDGQTGQFGFVDKNNVLKVPLIYEEAIPFDYTSFARVKRGGKEYLIDTSANEYWLATYFDEIKKETMAVDLRQQGHLVLPRLFFKNSQLKILLLADNRLKVLPDELGRFADLEVLDLKNNLLRDLPVIQLSRMKKLRWLNLSGNQINPEIVGELREKMPWCHIVSEINQELEMI